MKTWNAKANEVERKWWIVDATDQTVGRVATKIASVLRGKHKPQFTPHVDTGDFVIVINSEKLKFTGNKAAQKKYYWHGRNFGSINDLTAGEMLEKDGAEVITRAVRGMLPDNKLARNALKKLKAYTGPHHPHDAQKPEALSVN